MKFLFKSSSKFRKPPALPLYQIKMSVQGLNRERGQVWGEGGALFVEKITKLVTHGFKTVLSSCSNKPLIKMRCILT